MELTPVVELGVDEADAILVPRLGHADRPPLDVIEDEDCGRDLLLSRIESFPAEHLARLGLSREWPSDGPVAGVSAAPGTDDPGGSEVGAVVGDDAEPEAGLDGDRQG